MSENNFKPITTQAELDAVISDRLKRKEESVKAQFSDYEALKNKNIELSKELTDVKSTLEKVNANLSDRDNSINELNSKLGQLELTSLKTQIALQHGIPYNLASRLVGEDKESIIKDAEELSKMINVSRELPQADLEPVISDDSTSAYRNLLNNLDLQGE